MDRWNMKEWYKSKILELIENIEDELFLKRMYIIIKIHKDNEILRQQNEKQEKN